MVLITHGISCATIASKPPSLRMLRLGRLDGVLDATRLEIGVEDSIVEDGKSVVGRGVDVENAVEDKAGVDAVLDEGYVVNESMDEVVEGLVDKDVCV
jgi:hypothetical protein